MTEIRDRLYGRIELNEAEMRMLRTPELSRLRQVSLSAVPVWAVPAGTCASKAEHSIAAAHLTKLLTRRRTEFQEHARDIFGAALTHDVATPPFSHLAERFLQARTGMSHEDYAACVLDGSQLERELRSYGCSTETILAYIRGEQAPIGHLISGSLDLDNIDNVIRYATSLGILTAAEITYSPTTLAESFILHEGTLMLDQRALPDIQGWAECREKTYAFTYSPANLAPAAMVFRALDLADRAQELPLSFFRMRDDEAYSFLEERCNQGTSQLARRARHFETYTLLYNFTTHEADTDLRAYLADMKTRGEIADRAAALLKLEPSDVAVYAGESRAYRKIELALLNTATGETMADAFDNSHLPPRKRTWLIHVYARTSPKHAPARLQELLDSTLSTITTNQS